MSNVIDFAAALNARRANATILARETAARAEQERADIANRLGGTVGAQIIADVVMDLKAKEKEAGAPKFMPAYCDPANETRGSKYEATRNLPLTEVAKRMRDDIKELKLAKGFKVSVRVRHHSSIDIDVTQVPEGFRYYSDKYASWCKQFPHADYRAPMPVAERHSGQYNELKAKLQRIHDAYNRDNSDSMVDYFDVRYYGHAEISGAWKGGKAEIEAARGDYWADDCA